MVDGSVICKCTCHCEGGANYKFSYMGIMCTHCTYNHTINDEKNNLLMIHRIDNHLMKLEDRLQKIESFIDKLKELVK